MFDNESGNFDGMLAHASHLRSIENLNLRSPLVTLAGLNAFGIEDKAKLRIFQLDKSTIKMKELANFKFLRRLEHLTLREAEDPTAVLEKIAGCGSYKTLRLKGSHVTNHDLELISRSPASLLDGLSARV